MLINLLLLYYSSHFNLTLIDARRRFAANSSLTTDFASPKFPKSDEPDECWLKLHGSFGPRIAANEQAPEPDCSDASVCS